MLELSVSDLDTAGPDTVRSTDAEGDAAVACGADLPLAGRTHAQGAALRPLALVVARLEAYAAGPHTLLTVPGRARSAGVGDTFAPDPIFAALLSCTSRAFDDLSWKTGHRHFTGAEGAVVFTALVSHTVVAATERHIARLAIWNEVFSAVAPRSVVEAGRLTTPATGVTLVDISGDAEVDARTNLAGVGAEPKPRWLVRSELTGAGLARHTCWRYICDAFSPVVANTGHRARAADRLAGRGLSL